MLKYTDYVTHYKKDAEYFDYFSKDKVIMYQDLRRYQEYFHLLQPDIDDKVLEIGSGGGETLRIFEKLKFHYYPLDISYKNLNRMKDLTESQIDPVSADVFHLPFMDNVFDFVIMSEVLEHLDNTSGALQELKRVLSKNGTLLISVPYKERLSYQLCIHCNKPTPTFAHLQSFDEKKLVQYIEDAGLRPQKVLRTCNKLANVIKLNILLSKFPFLLWKFCDRLLNFIIPRPYYLIVVVKKV